MTNAENESDKIKELHKDAEGEDVKATEAQYALGCLHCQQKNFKAAREWFCRASDRGHIEAKVDLAHLYYFGLGGPPHPPNAVAFWEEAAHAGNAEAQFKFGESLRKGNHALHDPEQGMKWIRRAAEQGHKEAKDALAKLY